MINTLQITVQLMSIEQNETATLSAYKGSQYRCCKRIQEENNKIKPVKQVLSIYFHDFFAITGYTINGLNNRSRLHVDHHNSVKSGH